jgi:glycosyltransferase involved in cell wall biosynthesis
VTSIAFLLWPDTFEDWYRPLGIDRADYLTDYDGEWSTTLARLLVNRGVDVHLVHGTLGEAQAATHLPSGATAHFVPTTALYRGLRMLLWGHRWWDRMQWLAPAAPVASALSARLVWHLARCRPDVVVVQDYETLRYDIAAPLLRAAGLRVVGLDTGASARPSGLPWKRWTRGVARALLAVHEVEAERLRSGGHPSVAVWPVPVRTDVFVPRDRDAARAKLGLDPDEQVVFAAARLHPVKNLPMLARACDDVGATLVIAGEGAERKHLQRANVRLLGWQDTAALVTWYAACNVVALSSNQEGQPIAVLEALACGRGVVATAVGGVAEVVREKETGWLVRPGDRAAFAAALRDALADRATTDSYGLAGRDLVVRRHSAEAVTEAFTALAGL